jgi:LysR family transcriptional regulator, glycine cleavage system transcriptional activator
VIAEATNLVAPQSQRGYLVVASGPSFAAKWLQPRLPEFLRANPKVRIRLSTLSDHDDLETTRFDIAIAYGHPNTSKLDVEPLLLERLRPLCSPALAATLALHTPQDLLRATLIHSSNGLTWSEYFRRVCGEEVRPDNELWLDRSVMAIEAAVDGLGVVLESELLAAEELNDGRLIAPFNDAQFSIEVTSYYLVRSRGYKTSSQAAATFETWLRSAFTAANLTSN